MNDLQNSDLILTELRPPAAIITFNRPATRNALSAEMQGRLEQVVADLNSRRDIGTLIFTGSDNAFLSGANIRELTLLDEQSALAFSERGQGLCQRIAASSQRSIAAINGFCMGGGLDLALACDYRIATPAAEFAHPGSQLGIITGWGGTQRLPRVIGRNQAIEFFATARRLNAMEAVKLGLVHVVDPSPVEAALKLGVGPFLA
ncbi:MAG TPA: enoyl-CoA hydratase/isomerase family protein [Pyrinomonadaceae bacterium]|nr:enoyl-CoA hydratase/isomerase family protein [Pyrinomonadaceae bacterium]